MGGKTGCKLEFSLSMCIIVHIYMYILHLYISYYMYMYIEYLYRKAAATANVAVCCRHTIFRQEFDENHAAGNFPTHNAVYYNTHKYCKVKIWHAISLKYCIYMEKCFCIYFIIDVIRINKMQKCSFFFHLCVYFIFVLSYAYILYIRHTMLYFILLVYNIRYTCSPLVLYRFFFIILLKGSTMVIIAVACF